MENTNQIQIVKDETVVLTLEMVMNQLNESEDLSEIKSEIAGDLLVAKIALGFERTGKVNREEIKKYISEIY